MRLNALRFSASELFQRGDPLAIDGVNFVKIVGFDS